MAEAAQAERVVYEAGGGRKLILSLAFLILLPFYVSLGPMLFQRLVRGLWVDTVGLMIFSAIFTVLMALLAVQLYQALRSRVVLGPTSVSLTLPAGSGATPMLRFISREIPYDQIQAVETRCVLFGNRWAPVLLRATRLVTRDGHHVRLGNVSEDNVDRHLPFPEIGARIAKRAGVSVLDGGMVRRSIERRIMGFFGRKTAIEESPAVTHAELAEIGGRHKRTMRALILVLAVSMAGGIAMDVITAPRTSFATVGPSPGGIRDGRAGLVKIAARCRSSAPGITAMPKTPTCPAAARPAAATSEPRPSSRPPHGYSAARPRARI